MPAPEWLRGGSAIPAGGVALEVSYRTGTQTSKAHLPLINQVLAPVLGGEVFPGSLNFWADAPLRLPAPASALLGGADWLFVPVVIAERAVGVVARKADSGDIPFIEVFARDELVPRLGLSPGCRVSVRLLPGRHLGLAA